jgi:hypothetical protein
MGPTDYAGFRALPSETSFSRTPDRYLRGCDAGCSDAFHLSDEQLEHDPEKHALGLRPDGWKPVFPRDKRGTRLRGDHPQNKELEHDGDPLNHNHALENGELS